MHCNASEALLTVPGTKQMLKRNGGRSHGEDGGKAGVPGLGAATDRGHGAPSQLLHLVPGKVPTLIACKCSQASRESLALLLPRV